MKTPEIPFVPAAKTPRLCRDAIITEKIDGTRSTIFIDDSGELFCGSRNRWITPEADNYGFARWCEERKSDLLKLGPGRHDGEFWGAGIQRRYGLAEKRFSLFNVSRWASPEMIETPPACCSVVPVLHRGPFNTEDVELALSRLKLHGSFAAPGFPGPEGVVVYHIASGQVFKQTFDDAHKDLTNVEKSAS